jgi:hypothetical protein
MILGSGENMSMLFFVSLVIQNNAENMKLYMGCFVRTY